MIITTRRYNKIISDALSVLLFPPKAALLSDSVLLRPTFRTSFSPCGLIFALIAFVCSSPQSRLAFSLFSVAAAACVWGRDRHRVCLIGSLLSRYSPPWPLCSSLHLRCQLHKYTNLQIHTLSSQIGFSSASGFDLVVNFALRVPIPCPSSCPSVDLGPSGLINRAISSPQTDPPTPSQITNCCVVLICPFFLFTDNIFSTTATLLNVIYLTFKAAYKDPMMNAVKLE